MTNRIHIGIFGRRNTGKSSIINALTGQAVAIVSPTPGTTTDPVKKSIELFGVGPAVLIDTAGIDDEGAVGKLRTEKTKQVINQIDVAILTLSGNTFGKFEEDLIHLFETCTVPFVIVHNKADEQTIKPELAREIEKNYHVPVLNYSAVCPDNTEEIVRAVQSVIPPAFHSQPSLLEGLATKNDVVLLVTPVDSEAPEGRLILPQVQTIRAILDANGVAIILKETEVGAFLKNAAIHPKLIITDSQLFGKVDRIIPQDIPLTGFSILLARHKGDFENYLKGTPVIDCLQNGDRVLILESCTHQSTCDDIGRVKIPQWMQAYTGKSFMFDIVSGLSPLARAVTDYALVIQCGGCMVTSKQLKNRLKLFVDAGVPITNYGMTIAYMKGMYRRATAVFN